MIISMESVPCVAQMIIIIWGLTDELLVISLLSGVTTHLLSIERADWPKLHDMFKARDAM